MWSCTGVGCQMLCYCHFPWDYVRILRCHLCPGLLLTWIVLIPLRGGPWALQGVWFRFCCKWQFGSIEMGLQPICGPRRLSNGSCVLQSLESYWTYRLGWYYRSENDPCGIWSSFDRVICETAIFGKWWGSSVVVEPLAGFPLSGPADPQVSEFVVHMLEYAPQAGLGLEKDARGFYIVLSCLVISAQLTCGSLLLFR